MTLFDGNAICVETPDPRVTREVRDRHRSALDELNRRQLERVESPLSDLHAFFGGDADDLVSLSIETNFSDYLMAQRALAAFLRGWRVTRECRYNHHRPTVPANVERRAVRIGPSEYDFVIVQGRQFWVGPEGEKLVLDLQSHEDRREEYCELEFLIPRERYEWLRTAVPVLREWMDRHHFQRNRIITACGEFPETPDQTRWEDVLLPAETRRTLERNCIDLLRHSGLYKANDVPLRRGIILHGPPGTGKTMIGRALARHCGVTFILITPGMIEEPEDIRRVFDWGRRFAPTILFFEDFDLVASNRHGGGSSREKLGEFLTCLDGVDSAEGIITIATTNDLDALEPALKDRPNRFDCIMEIKAMEPAEREICLRRRLERQGGGVDAAEWARRTAGMTGAQMQELCRLAVFEAVEERLGENRTDAERVPIEERHMEKAFARLRKKDSRPIGFCRAETAGDEE